MIDLSMPSATMLSSAFTGGQVLAQSPLHAEVCGFAPSFSNRYSVKPCESTSTLPNGLTSMAFTTVVPGAAALPTSLARAPFGAMAHQVPPTASPVMSPDLASLAYWYAGQLLM